MLPSGSLGILNGEAERLLFSGLLGPPQAGSAEQQDSDFQVEKRISLQAMPGVLLTKGVMGNICILQQFFPGDSFPGAVVGGSARG